MTHIRQATGSPRAPRSVPDASAQTHRAKSPKRDAAASEAPVYHALAQMARDAGFREVTPSQVHVYAKARLLPPTAVRQSLGNRGFASELHPQVVDQLLALCELRKLTRSHEALAVLLWADGWDVPLGIVKEALLSCLPPARMSRSVRALDHLDRLARRSLPRLMRTMRPGRMGDAALDAAATLAPVAYGIADPIDDVAGGNLERLGGLDRGRLDAIGSAEPWLAGPPSFAWNVMLRYAPPWRVRSYIEAADAALLDRSRAHARFLIYEIPAFARGLEAGGGRGFGGWRFLARLVPRQAAMLGTIAVVLDRYPALFRRFDLLIEGISPLAERRDVLLELAAEYARQHPDQSALLRRHGLYGLVTRGLARRLDGVDELLARAEAVA